MRGFKSGALALLKGAKLRVELRVRQPVQANCSGQTPALDHAELIAGNRDAEGALRMVVKCFSPHLSP